METERVIAAMAARIYSRLIELEGYELDEKTTVLAVMKAIEIWKETRAQVTALRDVGKL